MTANEIDRAALRDALTDVDVLKRDPDTGISYIDPDLAVDRLADLLGMPAPEPEPEWKPGTVAVIEIDGDETYRAIRNAGGNWDSESEWTYGDAEVTDVRPLVVIDPAKVGPTAALVKAFDDGYYETDSTVGGLRAALRELGIEVPR